MIKSMDGVILLIAVPGSDEEFLLVCSGHSESDLLEDVLIGLLGDRLKFISQ
jgi:hypothetical protein